MTSTTRDVYLNDHLAGATLGQDLARQLQRRSAGSPLGDVMAWVAPQVEQDRESLLALMRGAGVRPNPVKQATAWLTEKTTRMKFLGITPGPVPGLFGQLETLTLGVAGKLALWTALRAAGSAPAAVLDDLIARARRQHDALERERVAMAGREFAE